MSETKEVLTRDFAKKRKEQLDNVKYDLFIDLQPKAETFSGICKVKFLLKDKKDGLILEFVGRIKNISVNRKKSKFEYDRFTIKLDEGLISGKENEVEIEYEGDYSHTGAGLHHFNDPEDGNEYLYSHFEPYDAHRMFPCFDQPDLKATLKLSVELPKDWTAISNEYGNEKINGKRKTVTFNETKKLSTYLYELGAGNYEFLEDSHNGMKMRIYFRKSMKKYVPDKEMFTLTKQGLDFYEKFFEYKYPFSKYDQIFVPEFNALAMEQPGAVTFTEEHFLLRREMTRTERSLLATTLIHEMAHMWFGDLVTMKWWDDLWLNESFADLMGYFVLVEATEFKDAWESFYARKAWAYVQDQYSTTHPIVADAEDTDIAFSNFDGISYAKGAAVLKQLMFYIGRENFRKGVVKYFKKYEWDNTELKDFLECLEEASKMDLKRWFDAWVGTTGVNSVTPEVTYTNNKVSSFKLIQGPSKDNGILREHKTKVALFYSDKPQTVKDIIYDGKETSINDFSNKAKPNFIFSNYEDNDYVKDRFDPESLKYVLSNVEIIGDNFVKQMVYGSLWQMVRDAELNPKDFVNLVLKNAEKEDNLFSLERMFLRVKGAISMYMPDKDFPFYAEKFFDLSLRMLNLPIDRELKNVWFSMLLYTSVGVTKHRFEKIVEILEGKIKFDDFELDQDRRWAIITRLNARSHEKADEFLEKERLVDKSARGEKMAAAAEASNIKNKRKFWEMFVNDTEKSVDFLRETMGGFYWKNQKKELKVYVPLFFENVKDIFLKRDKYYAKAFFGHLFPLVYAEEETLEKAKAFLKKHKDAPKLLRKDMQEGIDDLERALKVLNKYS
ncbi:aminopeptidase N [Candidatus Pacearchaeota archaeon]|nr:aminopeptidase N [Candidatus Pacearchaeota archaeon]